MAIATPDNLKKIDPNPQYIPTKLEGTPIDTKLYTPQLTNPELREIKLEFPKPLLEEISTPINIPEPVNENAVNKFLIIPNPILAEEAYLSIVVPVLETVEQNDSLYTPSKLETIDLVSYAYALPLKQGAYDFTDGLWTSKKEWSDESYPVIPINTSVINLSPDGTTNEDYRGLTSEWVQAWKELESQYDHSNFKDESWWSSIMPFNIKITNAAGEEVSYDYSIYKMKLPRKWMYKGAYLSYANTSNTVYDSHIDPDTGKQKGTIADVWNANKKVPDPNFEIPEMPVSQGWGDDAWNARREQAEKDWEEMWSAQNLKNVGLDLAKNFAVPILSSMLAFGGYDLSGKSSNEIGSTDPLPIDAGQERAIMKWVEISNYANSNLYKDIGKMVPQYLNIGPYGGFTGFESRYASSSDVYASGNDYRPHIFSNFLPSEYAISDHNTWTNHAPFTIRNRYHEDINIKSGNGQIKFNYDTSTRGTHPISLLNAIGPDFMKHKFDAFFVFRAEDGSLITPDFSKEEWMTAEQKFIYSHKGFAVRFGTINIPALSKDTFDVSYLETTVKKKKTSINGENKATFTFRLDNNLYWLDFFDKISAHNNTIDSLLYSSVEKTDKYRNVYYSTPNDNWKQYINYISNSFSPGYRIDDKDVTLTLIVKATHLSDYIHTGMQTEILPYFIFDDIRILGNSNAISFEREGNTITDMSINFIFKFLTEVYTLNKEYSNEFKYVEADKRNTGPWSNYIVKLPFKDTLTRAIPQIYTYEGILGI
jgi:hypothetical protein